MRIYDPKILRKKIKISWSLTFEVNKCWLLTSIKSQSGQWVQVNLTRCSKVTSHWSGPEVRVKRSEVTSHRSDVLYCQRLKVSQFIWVHKVKRHKSKVMGMLTSDLKKKSVRSLSPIQPDQALRSHRSLVRARGKSQKVRSHKS